MNPENRWRKTGFQIFGVSGVIVVVVVVHSCKRFREEARPVDFESTKSNWRESFRVIGTSIVHWQHNS